MRTNNELFFLPGYFYRPTDLIGLAQIPQEERLRMYTLSGGKATGSDALKALEDDRVPTHLLKDSVLPPVAKITGINTYPTKDIGRLLEGDVFLANVDGEPTFYRAVREFHYYDVESMLTTGSVRPANWLIDSGFAVFEARHSATMAFYDQSIYRQWERTFPQPATTPNYRWLEDPFSGEYDHDRARLCMGDASDYELANSAYMQLHEPLATAVKERMRWLSRQLKMANKDTGNHLLIDKASLSLMLNTLERDASNGYVARGEMVATVRASIEKLNSNT